MRYQPTKKSVRCLIAAEGFLDLNLPERAMRELDRIEDAGVLEPYCHFLRGQALRDLERFEEAIDPLQEAARTIPAPYNRQAWEDLSDCFRHEGLQELADVAEMFAEDPMGGADRDLSDPGFEEYLFEIDPEFTFDEDDDELCDRTSFCADDDFEQYDFDAKEAGFVTESNPASRKRPQK